MLPEKVRRGLSLEVVTSILEKDWFSGMSWLEGWGFHRAKAFQAVL